MSSLGKQIKMEAILDDEYEDKRKKMMKQLNLKPEEVDAFETDSETDDDEDIGGKKEYSVEKVLNIRCVEDINQYHVKWRGYDEKDSTWEPLECFTSVGSRIAILQYYERKWKKEEKKQAAKHKPTPSSSQKVIKKENVPEHNRDMQKKFGSSAGDKRSGSSAQKPQMIKKLKRSMNKTYGKGFNARIPPRVVKKECTEEKEDKKENLPQSKPVKKQSAFGLSDQQRTTIRELKEKQNWEIKLKAAAQQQKAKQERDQKEQELVQERIKNLQLKERQQETQKNNFNAFRGITDDEDSGEEMSAEH